MPGALRPAAPKNNSLTKCPEKKKQGTIFSDSFLSFPGLPPTQGRRKIDSTSQKYAMRKNLVHGGPRSTLYRLRLPCCLEELLEGVACEPPSFKMRARRQNAL